MPFVFVLVLIPMATKSFAEESFDGDSSVDPPLSEVVAGQSSVMTIRFLYTSGPYAMNDFTPVIEVNPSSARQFVQVDVDPIDITQGQIRRIPITLTVDPHIEHEKIFLSISYTGHHFMSGNLQKSSWTDQIELDVKGRLVPEPEPDKPIPENCGSGTTLQDGICVVDDTEENLSNSSVRWGGPVNNVESPLKQFKSGVSFDEIKCKQDFILIQKHDGSPACVTESTKQKLIERGWIDIDISESKNNSENDTLTTQIVVDPSNNFYFSDDEIIIRGSVWDSEMTNLQKIPVVLQISFDDELVDVAEVTLSDDGIFSHNIMASGPLWKQSGIYTTTASYDSQTAAQNKFGFSAYYQDTSERYFVNSDTDDYEDLCGYPVTHEMRRDIVESIKHEDDRIPLVELNQGVFTHVERSLYLTDMPRLQYWYDLEDERQMYFEIEACAFDNSFVIGYGHLGPNYEKSQDIVVDGVYHKILSAPGSPLIYKDSLLPVLDIDNCKRVAENYTKEERYELYLRENAHPEASWNNQIFPLMDYCTNIGNFEMRTVDGNINWIFTEK